MNFLISGILGICLAVSGTVVVVANQGAPKPATVKLYNYGTR